MEPEGAGEPGSAVGVDTAPESPGVGAAVLTGVGPAVVEGRPDPAADGAGPTVPVPAGGEAVPPQAASRRAATSGTIEGDDRPAPRPQCPRITPGRVARRLRVSAASGPGPHERRIHAEHVANPLRRQDLGWRAVRHDTAAVEQDQAREEVRGEA